MSTRLGAVIVIGCLSAFCSATDPTLAADEQKPRPNILFCIADDWGWPHAGAYGDPVVKTPTFDRIAREGVLFRHAYVSSPSCTPSRGAILTGQWHWRLEAGGNLWCIFPDKFKSYPEILKEHGYFVGVTGKGWGPGRMATPDRQIEGQRFRDFPAFLAARPKDQPFCFWLGSGDPHRPYEEGTGVKSGMQLDKIRLPACFPDVTETRSDVADYYFEVQRFDRLVGDALAALEKVGELDNTLVLMTGDHGMPFPRGKGNLYDSGVHVPLAVRWPKGIKPARTVEDFVSTTDLAPTYLELAGVARPADMTGRSLASVLNSDKSGRVDPQRDRIFFGKERHVPCQEAPDMGGYPCRGMRTSEYMYIRNFTPDRWPNGTPHFERATIRGVWLGDCDNGPSKTYMVNHQDRDATHRRLYDLAFAKRPAEELYDLKKDPNQLSNVASDPAYSDVKVRLANQLTAQLRDSGDPRILGGAEDLFEKPPYLGQGPRHPSTEGGKKKSE